MLRELVQCLETEESLSQEAAERVRRRGPPDVVSRPDHAGPPDDVGPPDNSEPPDNQRGPPDDAGPPNRDPQTNGGDS